MGKRLITLFERGNPNTQLFFWMCLLACIMLAVVSFLLPPQGVIDRSVVEIVSIIMGFATIGCGLNCITQGMNRVHLSKGDLEIDVTPKVNENEEDNQ